MFIKILLSVICSLSLFVSSLSFGGLIENTAYIGNTLKMMCETANDKKECESYANAYLVRYSIPTSDKSSDLLAYETGFVADVCQSDGFVQSLFTQSRGACLDKVTKLSKFPEVTETRGKCANGAYDASTIKCYSDELMKIHDRLIKASTTQTDSCEARLLRAKTELSNMSSKVFTGSQKNGIQHIIDTLSSDTKPAPQVQTGK